LVFIAVITIIIICSFWFTLKYLIIKPLSDISRFLDSQDPAYLSKTKHKNDEFGKLSNLLIDFNNQKLKIENEIKEKISVQNSLIESQKRLHAIISSSPNVAIEGFDINGKVLFWNNAATKIFGYTEKEAVGKTLNQLILDEQGFNEFMNYLQMVDKTNAATEPTEWTTKDKKNNVVTVLSTIFPIFSELSDKKIFICMDVDITERILLEKELKLKNQEIITQNEELTVANQELTELYSNLRNSEEIFRSVIMQANDGVLLLDEKCKIIRWNKALETITGFTAEETLGNYIWDIEFQLMPAEKRTEEIKNRLEKTVKDIALHKKTNTNNTHFEGTICTRNDSKLKYVRVSTFIIHTEKSFLIGRVVYDLTNILEAKKTLEKSEKRFRELAEMLPSVVFEIDLDGKATYLNKKALELFGFENEYYSDGVSFRDSMPAEYQEKAFSYFETIIKDLNNDPHRGIEFPLLTKSGIEIPCLIYISLIKDLNNNPVGARGVLIDISLQKKTEELQKQLEISRRTTEIKQQFLANMSHEIRTPMMGIIGMIDLLNKTKVSKLQQDYIETIKDSSETLLNIINDILDLSKIEAGKTQLKPVIFNIHSITQKIRTLFSALAKHKKISYLTGYTDELPDYIFADENKITQIITNLVSNAVKFTSKGSVTVKFGLASRQDDKLKVKVEVIDTGIGINDENKELIFKTFTQLDSANTRNFDGTGLGLSICQKLTHLMGGEIGVTSELGKGSTFWFTFDAETADTGQIIKTITDSNKTVTRKLNLKILLVEDKEVNQKVIELMLKDAGCKTDIASNGQMALEMYQPGKYDLILMDIQMPVMDGISTLQILRKKYRQIEPVIALSANVMEGDEEQYLAAGMDDYIGKPVTQYNLIEKINLWVK